jgi:hypothetical protein
MGYTFQSQFIIIQHKCDVTVLKRIIKTLKCEKWVKPFLNINEYNIINNKGHLNIKGLNELKISAYNMNSYRKLK